MLAAVVLAASLGVVAGAVVGVLVGRSTHRQGVSIPVPSAAASVDADEVRLSSLREAVDRLVIGVVICGRTGTVTYRNTAAAAMASTHEGLVVDDHLAQVFTRVLADGAANRVVELHGPPRQILVIDANAVPTGGAVATIQDISERARIDSMRTDFVANISHELKTPVGAIAVLAETLQDEPDPAVSANLSGRLVEEAHRAVRTIDDLLELSQIESARLSDDVVDLTELVDLAIARGRSLARGRNIEITALDTGNRVRLRGDRRQLVSALGNLVENAVKYSHDGDTVQIRARSDDRWIELMIADQGVGIPPRDLDRVFERFYRVDKARARQTGGTGLGLAIVRNVAGNHGGEVLVQSQEGEGSTFVFRLPARLIMPDAPLEPPGPNAALTGSGDGATADRSTRDGADE